MKRGRQHIIKFMSAAIMLLMTITTAKAQTELSGTAQQVVTMGLSNVAEIGFVNSDNIVSLYFNDVNDYADGVESNEQILRIRSNKKFDVRVKANTSKFSYTGNASVNPNMAVANVLNMKITTNNTGGSIASGFSAFKNLSTSGKKIINNGNAGDNQTFAVKYKAIPGFAFPAGTYTVDIVFTVTQK